MTKAKNLEMTFIAMAIRGTGSHLTRESRSRCLAELARILSDAGFGIERPDQLGLRHVRVFIEKKKLQGLSDAALANFMSHIRVFLRAIGKSSLAADPNMSNKALGIKSRSRNGTKQPFEAEELSKVLELVANERGGGGYALCLLSVALGLREQEVVIADVKQLAAWERDLSLTGQIVVASGTKGGRARNVIPLCTSFALSVLRYAIRHVGPHGYLVLTAAGKPTSSLLQSMRTMSNYFSRRGIQHHRFRYTYAVRLAEMLHRKGHPWSVVWKLVAVYLGHGDGRGRWAKQVYGRSLYEKQK